MNTIRGIAIGAALGAALIAPTASAQNVGSNAGIWWTPVTGQPAAFTVLNPLTTIYGRIGFLRSFSASSDIAFDFFGIPVPQPGTGIAIPDQWGGVLGLGARLMPVLRYELQLGGMFSGRANLASSIPVPNRAERVSSTQLMNNLYVDIAPFFANGLWGMNPYIFGGVGISWNSTGDTILAGIAPVPGSGVTRALFAWNIGAGLQWQVMRNLILDLGYRYLDAGSYRTITTPPVFTLAQRFDNVTHQVMFSLVVPVDGLVRGFGN